jgi:hypothetical protein
MRPAQTQPESALHAVYTGQKWKGKSITQNRSVAGLTNHAPVRYPYFIKFLNTVCKIPPLRK